MASQRVRRLKQAAGISLITLVLLEIALRFLLGGAEHGAIYYFYTQGLGDGRCVGLRPNTRVTFTGFVGPIDPVTLEVNGMGYRGPERPREKPDSVFRVAAVGDSYTYGISETSESIPAHLERGLGVEVLNFGIPGAQLVDLVSHAKIHVMQWRPDVLLFILYSNDLDEPLCAWTSPPYSWVASLAKAVYLFRIPFILTVVGEDADAQRAEREAVFGTQIRELANLDTKLAIVVLGESPVSIPVLTSTLAEHGIPLLDATEWIRELPRLKWDGHFTAEGNRSAAQRIAEWIRRQGLVENGGQQQ